MEITAFVRLVLRQTQLLAGAQPSVPNFHNAKVVTLSGDTLQGMVNDKNWLKNPDLISFKSGNQKAVQKFKPTDINSVIIDSGDYYLSAEEAKNYGLIDEVFIPKK